MERHTPHWLSNAQTKWTSVPAHHDRYARVVAKHEDAKARFAAAPDALEELRAKAADLDREEAKALTAARTPGAWKVHFPDDAPPADNQKDLSAWGKKRLKELRPELYAARGAVAEAEHVIKYGPQLITEAALELSHFEEHDLGQAWQHIFREPLPPRPCVIDEWTDTKQTYALYAGGRIATTGEYEGILITEGGFTMYDELLDSMTAAQSRLSVLLQEAQDVSANAARTREEVVASFTTIIETSGALQRKIVTINDELGAIIRDLSAKKAEADANAQKAKNEQSETTTE